MNEEQMKSIAAYITGLEVAVVHLCQVLDSKGLVDQVELVKSFEATAQRIPEEVANRKLVAKPLLDIAQGLRVAGVHGAADILRNFQQP